jgi:hypothetical protein
MLVMLVLLSMTRVTCNQDDQFLLFMKSPTAASPAGNCTFTQRNSSTFTSDCLERSLEALKLTNSTIRSRNRNMTIGFTYQFEVLDCFLSPHDCELTETGKSIDAFLNACVEIQVPCGITIDPYQFWKETNLWNWFDPSLSDNGGGYNPDNVENVEWTNFSNTSATSISWRNWGSQFRMTTPQPNIASPKLLEQVSNAVGAAVSVVRSWYERQSSSKNKNLLVSLKIAEELDVGANFFFYKNGNTYRTESPSKDPRTGPDWSKGLSGGPELEALGYNMLRTLNLRHDGGPPTRDEIKIGIQNYFNTTIQSAINVWPLLKDLNILFTHGGLVGDHLIPWSSAMVEPSSPAYSFYLSKSQRPGGESSELAQSLTSYDPTRRQFAVGEYFCVDCTESQDWLQSLENIFLLHNSSTLFVRIVSVYNLSPFASSKYAVDALHQFLLQ